MIYNVDSQQDVHKALPSLGKNRLFANASSQFYLSAKRPYDLGWTHGTDKTLLVPFRAKGSERDVRDRLGALLALGLVESKMTTLAVRVPFVNDKWIGFALIILHGARGARSR